MNRRSFIKKSAVATAAAIVAPTALANVSPVVAEELVELKFIPLKLSVVDQLLFEHFKELEKQLWFNGPFSINPKANEV